MYPKVQDNLVAYVKMRKEKYNQDKCGLSWLFLEEKCLQWAQQFGYHDFKASSSFINNTEGNDLSQEEFDEIMIPWRKEFHRIIVEKGIPPNCIYNADQSGLFYQKLPNSLYVSKDEKYDYRGEKQIKIKNELH